MRLIEERSIDRVLHFTTNNGLLGVLRSGLLLSRDQLSQEQRVETIRLFNNDSRTRDQAWTGYVNLSISTVNTAMLASSRSWHADQGVWWAVLSFDPVIMAHPGVTFTTTNNVYPVVRRAGGGAGLNALFDPQVPYGYYGSVHRREAGAPLSQPTDPTAEVLYPGGVPLTFLRGIYVFEEEHLDQVAGWVELFPTAPHVEIACRPDVFA
ncbi:DarT ssDNA thymidine ADP-ribosyltransferase family protein [Oerskovia sp. KBS0722]|uniref:DarT ssDNA thymidine ADP-ribosyltransferase family protein n=1 Tax=Oerskovia sp. KBS0722 TaxID=1179673 RepID=UPI00143D2B31|nr:DarT ssDNA thymidine ADP-ribosyltransferase family protein [Oerskovia sp. KBS0722]